MNANITVARSLKSSLTEVGLSRIIASNSRATLREFKGVKLDHVGAVIAPSTGAGRKATYRRAKTASGSSSKMYSYAPDNASKKRFWARVKKELHLFICTNDKKYAALRKQILAGGVKSQTAIVSAVSAGIASSLGVVAGLVVPLVALGLLAIVKVSKEAYCEGAENLKI